MSILKTALKTGEETDKNAKSGALDQKIGKKPSWRTGTIYVCLYLGSKTHSQGKGKKALSLWFD